MELAICTDVYADLSLTEMLDRVKAHGITAVEMTAGRWGARTRVNTKELLESKTKREELLNEFKQRGMRIEALNCSCNQLRPARPAFNNCSTKAFAGAFRIRSGVSYCMTVPS